MTRPPDGGSGQPPGQPWWQRPGGAPQPGGPATPPPQRPQYPPQRPQYPAPQRPQYPPPPQQPPPHYPPQQQPGWPPAARPTPQWTPAETPAQQYGQQPAAHQPPPAKPRQSRLPMIAGAVAAVVVIGGAALIGGLWISGFLGGGTVLDVGAAEAGVTEILSNPINGYGANDVSAVKCNGGKNPKVEVGAGFSCDVTIKGAKRTVQVVFQDDLGTYEVDGPR
ncbi:DUF4333 domain-containing protein [Mycobacterium sp. 29Ha]|uniref:DUF4333 domain-containing protein n=1 Tax=Mycobacterium sp. 29Ha TaxID=2939268 RepID=UPI002938F104|nr:DUF4333 domain-containing protein [Mycobacterium sp. 29Ha]MDV3135563.1 DUF4333 domain-containing protein [Mycobacterium sp. 29Ha]